jgi:hypothetical protein
MKAAAHRHTLMLAVTAGEDSRALLAASRDICSSVYFFINKHPRMNDETPDIKIPKNIFQRIGVPFHVHQYPTDVPEEFSRLFFQNAYYARKHLLPVIYHIYYLQHSDKLNVVGVGEVGRTKFFNEPKKLNPYYLAYMLHYRRSTYAVKECEKWLSDAKPFAHRYGLNIMTLFWWEILIGNWGAVGNSESDIAIEEYDPYNSHLLYEMFLSIDAKYRTFRDNVLFKTLIYSMWPKLLDEPFNPPESLKDHLVKLLNKFGFETALRSMKARFFEFSFYSWGKHRKI